MATRKPQRNNYQRAANLFQGLATEDKQGKPAEFLAMADEAQFQQAYCLTQLGQFETAAKVYAEVAARPDSAFRVRSLVNAGRSYALAGKNGTGHRHSVKSNANLIRRMRWRPLPRCRILSGKQGPRKSVCHRRSVDQERHR